MPDSHFASRMIRRPLLSFLLCILACAGSPRAQEIAGTPLHRLTPATAEDLRALLRFSPEPMPLVSAHRGGPAAGFPENCLATFEHTLQSTFAMLEVDPRRTLDGAIVLHHDATLERTTTGAGRVADHTLKELKQLRLKDPKGQSTPYHMPTLDEAIAWARGRTVLVLDQKDVDAVERAGIVTRHKAEAYVVLIVSSFADAMAVHRLNPEIAMEVMIPTLAKAREFDQFGVSWSNVVAFVGHKPPEDPELYAFIHGKGACCMIGTSRNLDRRIIQQEVPDIQALEPDYRTFLKRGADIIETDIPALLGPLLYHGAEVPEAKRAFFGLR